jgi:multiple sugar transport system substrate-binding protein
MRYFKKISLLLLAVFIMTTGFGCIWDIGPPKDQIKPITLEYWGVWDTKHQLSSLINDYQANHPTIQVRYRNFRYDEYETKLIEAWADDRGPDIFAIPVSWLKTYQHRIVPMPSKVTIPVQEVSGRDTIIVMKDLPGLSTYDIKDKFVPVVYDDIVLDDKVYGLPYYIDTLVTFYNNNLLVNENIAEPIATWHDLIEQAPKLTKATIDNDIYQSAVSMGTADNIPRFFDIISAIMLQYEVPVKGKFFDPLESKDSTTRAREVLSFYTDFAKPGRASFSWTSDLDNAFEMFANGRVAYFFGYSYHADELKNRGIQFDWRIANFPQTRGGQGTKYFTNYWVNVVAKKSDNQNAAWNFVQTTASQQSVEKYLLTNTKPTALRALVDSQRQDNDLRVFVDQVLTADNWYEGYDIDLAEQYTAEIIEALVDGSMILDIDNRTLGLLMSKIRQTYIKPE